jgi:site-specific DNA recombinase
MSQTVAYVRVSTEDQVDLSPAAQAKRCRDFARLRELGPVKVLADEGWSGKNLDRPAMRDLLALIEGGQVTDLVIWRWDRLSRDQGDFAALVKLFDRHGIKVHSVNEGDLDTGTASGKMQIGVHGVFAQYYRDHIVENVLMGNRQAIEHDGRWLNRAPTGYDMVDGELVPNELAPLVQRTFALRAAGASYPTIAAEVGIGYSTVRHICENRVYLGETRLRDEWFPGRHQPLVTLEEFNAVARGHTAGRRRSKDLLSGIARCGLCGRVAGVEYNERNQALYRCKHRGKGCAQPARSANGLHRAAVLGMREIAGDIDLQAAIRAELTSHRQPPPTNHTVAATINGLNAKVRKLLDLYYADQISADTFATEEQRLTSQIEALRTEATEAHTEAERRDELADRFDQVAEVLAALDLDTIWDEATETERRTLVADLVDSVHFYPDQITVQVVGAPPILVTLAEVGLRAGTRTVVSEGGLEPPRP